MVWGIMATIWRVVPAAIALAIAGPAVADSRAPATRATYVSPIA
jgi:hypothetical protein